MIEPNEEETRPAEIEAEIGETRSKISENLSALGEKLTPENVKENIKEEAKQVVSNVKEAASEKVQQVKDEVRERARYAGDTALDFARHNAAPLALVGIGLGWLMVSRRNGNGWRRRGWRSAPASEPIARHGDVEEYYLDQSALEQEGPGEKIARGAQRLKRRAEQKMHEGADRARELRGQAEGKFERIRGQAEGRLEQIKERSRHFADENPLAVGALAMAAGVGVGLLVPHTRREDEWLGPTRDRLLGEARGAAQDIRHTIEETAHEVKEQVVQH